MSGWTDLVPSFSLDTGEFSLEGTIWLDIGFTDALSSSIQTKVSGEGVEWFTLQGSWYERPLRLSGSCKFKEGVFYKANAEFRYWEDPWLVKLKGELPAEEPTSITLLADYDDDVVEGHCESLWEDTGLDRLDAWVELPTLAGWRARVAATLKSEQTPSLKWRACGITPWGELTLEWREATLSRLRLYRELEQGDWQHEIDLDWESGYEPELWVDSSFYLDEDNGYGLSLKMVGFVPLTFQRASLFRFGPGWKASLDPVNQELALKAAREVDGGELGCDLIWSTEGLEGELWLDLYCEVMELIGELAWEEGLLEELSLELYLEF